MSQYNYQKDFSCIHAPAMYDQAARVQKARKIIAVLAAHFGHKLNELHLLDLGCSTGFIARFLSEHFAQVTATDIDSPALDFAVSQAARPNLTFSQQDAMNLAFPDQTFDVVICAHIYEHVPDAKILMAEIRRVLKQGGVCYFAAGNRLIFTEAHYKLPLLSVIPKSLAHLYLRLLKRGSHYYENHLTLWGLRKLTAQFELIDFTRKIIADPERYAATDMLTPGSKKHQTAQFIARYAYFLCPTYIWLLTKRSLD